ncbi:MAG: hypothetical protein HYS36_14315 [Candidatus Rokubacteria bacterium]|nr:hypothetical protein [Candidatus Rokubacteria bacterium]MBI2527600.1 hypothetical protein [Candidatus Rokubacteria bacterium]
MTEGASATIPATAALAELHALCGTTAAAFREGHQLAAGSHEHTERMLAWLSGLMGAGIFSVQGLLATAPLPMRLSAFVPWTLGILYGVLGRLLQGELPKKDDQQHFRRISTLELLRLETDADLIRRNLRPILEAATFAKDEERRRLERLLTATNGVLPRARASVCARVLLSGSSQP